MIARMHVADEGFKPVGDELDRSAKQTAERSGSDLVAVDMQFDAETAADIGTDHADLVFVDPEMPGKHVLLLPGCLVRRVNGQTFIAGIPVGHRRARLQRDTRVAAESERCGYGSAAIVLTGIDTRRGLESQVVDVPRMNGPGVRAQRGASIGNRRQWLPVDDKQVGRVFRKRPRCPDDRGKRFALPSNGIHRQRMLFGAPQRWNMSRAAGPRLTQPGHFSPRYNGDDTVGRRCRRRVDRPDARMRVGRSREHDMDHPGKLNIVRIPPPAGDEPPGIGPANRFPHQAIVIFAHANAFRHQFRDRFRDRFHRRFHHRSIVR